MFLRLLILFTLVPLIELALLIQVGARVGVLPTIALVLTTGLIGAALARSQGGQAYQRLQQTMAAGRFPGEEIFDGVLILGGGLLLLTPGLITDLIGFAALVPGTRVLLKSVAKKAVRSRIGHFQTDPVDTDYKVY